MRIIMVMTWKEMLRKRVMTLSLVMTFIFLIALWFLARAIGSSPHPNMGPSSMTYLVERYAQGAMIIALGIFFGAFVIAFLAIFSSVGVIAGEAEQGVLQALLPRPIARWRWFLGRWLGYVSLGVIYAALLFGSILLIAKIHATLPGDLVSLLKSFVLFAFVVPLLVSVSMLGSCFFSALGNGVFMVMLFGAGWLGGMIGKVTGIGTFSEDKYKSLNTISGLLSLVMPTDAIQQRMLAEMFPLDTLQGFTNLNQTLGPFAITQVPSNAFLIYVLGYMLIALAFGIFFFQRKDL
jgi:ABC-type transport system involved in multi-copper enzyme maturation permease subunit